MMMHDLTTTAYAYIHISIDWRLRIRYVMTMVTYRSRDAHLQSALVVGEMKRAVSNPQITFICLATSRVTWVQLSGLFTQARA